MTLARRLGPVRMLIVALASLGLVAGLLAMHSMAGTHASAAIQHSHQSMSETDGSASAGTAVTSTPGVLAVLSCEGACASPCAVMGGACLLLLVLLSALLAAALPALLPRLLQPPAALGADWLMRIPSLRPPSLTVLCISRT